MSSLITRIRATTLPKKQIKICNMMERDLLVRIAKEMGYDTKGKREETLCKYILVKVARNPKKYGKYLDEIYERHDYISNMIRNGVWMWDEKEDSYVYKKF